MTAVAVEFSGRGAAFVAIGCGNPAKYPEDGIDGMRRRAHEKHYPFPYLFDEGNSVARAIGATIAPEVLVFGHDRQLCYRGAIAQDTSEGRHSTLYLREALEALIAGKLPPVSETRPIGCQIEAPED